MTRVAVFFACISAACAKPPAAAKPAREAKAEAAPAKRCLASFATKRPASGWIESGRFVVTMRKGHAFAVEIHDASGRVTDFVRLMRERELLPMTCKLGGVLAVVESPVLEGQETMIVLRPAAEDERADLRAACATPDSAERFDAQRLNDELAARLTSTRWRTWLFDLRYAMNREDDDEVLRLADVLEAEAQREQIDPCWTSDWLRSD
ncbi:MAG TPA: hypothetical protein VIF62_00750 [Labilithrix sp.]|jgi:hypothetical protein